MAGSWSSAEYARIHWSSAEYARTHCELTGAVLNTRQETGARGEEQGATSRATVPLCSSPLQLQHRCAWIPCCVREEY